MASIFISYCHENAEEVAKVTDLFDRHGIEYWIDYKSIRLGRKYQADIVQGIEQCDIFLFVYSEKSNRSDDQMKELGIATDAHKLVIPFMLDNSEWNPALRYMASSNQGIETWKTGMDFALKALYNGILNYEGGTEQSTMPTNPVVTIPSHVVCPVATQDADDELDLDYEDAADFMQAGELQDALNALQLSFENGNMRTIPLFNKLLFQNFGNKDWEPDTWAFLEQRASDGHSFALLAYFYKLQHNKETHPQAASHVKAALKDKQNGYAFLCEGIAREQGIGMAANLHSAMKRYEQALKMGVTEAGSYLAEMYLNGSSGVDVDKQRAVRLLEEGCERQDARSCYVLGRMYAEEAHLEENWQKAASYLKKAIALHQDEAWIDLGNLHRFHRFSEGYNNEALSCYLEALKAGQRDAHAYISRIYWEEGREEDALIEARKGVRAGSALAASALGDFYAEGLQNERSWMTDKKPDYPKAWECYQQAYDIGGRIEDSIKLAQLYVEDKFRPEHISWEVIEDYLKRAAEVPIVHAIELLVEVLKANDREKDVVNYLEKGAKCGSLPMMFEYGRRMLSADEGIALKYIEAAGEKGHKPSIEWLQGRYSTYPNRSAKDYRKWMDIAVRFGVKVYYRDYLAYLLETDADKAGAYLQQEYVNGNMEALKDMAEHLPLLKLNREWVLSELHREFPKLYIIGNDRGRCHYADLLFSLDDEQGFSEFVRYMDEKDPQFVDVLLLMGQSHFPTSEAYKGDAIARRAACLSTRAGMSDERRALLQQIALSGSIDKSQKKILVVDDVVSNVLLLKILLSNEKYQVITASNGKDCLALAEKEQPSIILLDAVMPDMDGFETTRRLKASKDTQNIPVMLLIAEQASLEIYNCGAIDYIAKPFNKEELSKKVLELIMLEHCARFLPSQEELHEKRILIVDDVASNDLLLRILLTNEGFQVISTYDGGWSIAYAKQQQPDLILMDVMMPALDGFTACRMLKEDPLTSHIPLIFLTALNNPSDLVHGYQVGGDDFLTKPFNKEELVWRVTYHLRISHAKMAYLKSIRKEMP